MLKSFQKHIDSNLPFLRKSKLLIAISGGLDSVILTHLCKALQLDIALAHCNFNLRASESDADQEFVIQLAKKLDLEVFLQSFNTNTVANSQKISTQMAARDLRYSWFQELSKQLQFDYILTAHHADDNLETFLINLTRGTGLDGLTGIPELNQNVVRPLLKFTRNQIQDYANANNLQWREDSSNASTKYLRNKLRHEVIPKLKEINPELLQNFENTQNHLQSSKNIIEEAVNTIKKEVVLVEGQVVKYNINKLKALSNTNAYLFELFKEFNFTQWNDVYKLLDAQSGKQVFSKTHRLVKDRTHLLLTTIDFINEENTKNNFLIEEKEQQIVIPLGSLVFKNVEAILEKNSNTIYIDKDLLKFPLTVRQWEKGDYFYPLGMQGKKKLSKYFKDEKLSLLEKENIWVLCSNNNIVWIIGKRADNRFKITNSTTQTLKITIQ